KALAAAQLTSGERVPVLGDLLGLSLIYNPGAAASLGAGGTWVVTLASVPSAVMVDVLADRLRGPRGRVALWLVLRDSVGTLADRLVSPPSFGRGHVTDFIAYGVLFVGNIADVLVVAGVGLICLNLLLPSTQMAMNSDQRTEHES